MKKLTILSDIRAYTFAGKLEYSDSKFSDFVKSVGVVTTVSTKELEEMLGYDVGIQSALSLPEKIERQWGELEKYRGISTSSKGFNIILQISC